MRFFTRPVRTSASSSCRAILDVTFTSRPPHVFSVTFWGGESDSCACIAPIVSANVLNGCHGTGRSRWTFAGGEHIVMGAGQYNPV